MTNTAENTRTAVVTGASAGIGAAAAEALAADGWHVVLTARREDRLREVQARIQDAGGQATVIVLDVTDQDSIDAVAKQLAAEFGSVDLLVNNAGGACGLVPIVVTGPSDLRCMSKAKVMGTLQATRALYEQLKAGQAPQGINVVSMAVRCAYRKWAGYKAAKFGETAFTDVM